MSYGRNRSLPPGAGAVLRELREFPADSYGRMYVPKSQYTATYMGSSARTATEEQRANRQAYKYRGVGAYSVGRNWRKFSQSIGLSNAGKTIVNAAAATGAQMIKRAPVLMGMGAYTTNSLMTDGGISDQVPMVSGTGDETGGVYISKREYITDIFAPATPVPFENKQYPLNPGLEGTFPWLSQIAANYEEYELLQCVFYFRSTVTDIGSSTSGQVGTVIMATKYNASSAPFTDKGEMMEYAGAMSSKSTDSMAHGVECDPRKLTDPGGYIRSGPVGLYQDSKTYDHGVLNVAVANMPSGYAGQSIGELWVSYTVKLKTPKFFSARGGAINRDIYVSGKDSETTTKPMGTDAALLAGQQNSLGTQLDLSFNNQIVISFPSSYAGFTRIVLRLEGSTVAGTLFQSAGYTGNVRLVNDIYGSSGGVGDSPSYVAYNGGSIGGGAFNLEMHVYVNPPSGAVTNTVVITLNTMTTANTQGCLEISEYNGMWSTKALNLGPTGSQTEAPILVNKSGAVVHPETA